MGDHIVDVNRLVKPEISSGVDKRQNPLASSSAVVALDERMDEAIDEEAPLITVAECRICQDEDDITSMESPCACSGSLKYAHRKCVQHWCNEKGDITCEICHQTYHPDYTAPPRPQREETTIDIGGGWHISGTPLDLHDPRILAITEAERQILEAEYDEYNSTNASGASFFRSAALILMALLLLRHAVTVTDADEDDDESNFFTIFLLRATGFLLPCYIMAWAISIMQRRRQRQQEAAALAATQFALVIQSRTPGGLHFTLASSPALASSSSSSSSSSATGASTSTLASPPATISQQQQHNNV
ncbi:RING-CH-type domain-containing protein [Heracleum sosnowskyi]|uniref:RING-CH-type domain-containing protein n=1 Tax=Heracleum sosnowskyi TaxID=360622 RepID=A0AAD8M714_9APIA|nr:RING-CH-type domain-containing protein [Heracleum sosnowskyi]